MGYLFCCSSFSLRSLNYSAAIFHLIQAAIVLGIIQHLKNKEEGNYGLNSGIFKLSKNIWVIQSIIETKSQNENVFEAINNNNNKCDLPKVDIINVTKHNTLFYTQLNNEIKKISNVSSVFNGSNLLPKAFPLRTINIFSPTPPHNDMMITVQRNDIFMFDDNENNKYYAIPQTMQVGELNIQYIIFSFFLLSGLFQLTEGFLGTYSSEFIQGNSGGSSSYKRYSTRKPSLLRFIEYSFSASIMILAIAVETGVNDIYTLCAIFALMFTTNILGFIAEILCFCSEVLIQSDQLKFLDESLPIGFVWLWVFPHFLGWVTCFVGYAPLLDSYLSSSSCSERGPPGFVHIIVFLEFVLFSCFGLVQLYSLFYRTKQILYPRHYNTLISRRSGSTLSSMQSDDDAMMMSIDQNDDYSLKMSHPYGVSISEKADYMYILLSFIAKTLLAWLILSPSLM
jgi:hypothetical protein